VVTSGTFDGVHVGHQKIIERLIQRARQSNGQSVVVTYWPHPRLVLPGDHASLRLLSTIEERIEQLSQYAIDYLLIIPFTPEFAALDRAQYVRQILVESLRAKVLIIGYDHRFGKDRAGNLAYLQEHAQAFGFAVEEIPAQDIDQIAVSSTRIRQALEKGDITTANTFLGHPYRLQGQVVHGKKLGRTIGFPTANLAVTDPHKLVPAQGIYAVRVQVGTALLGGMLSIGTNPTVGGSGQTIEVYIFDFDQDIYDQIITLYFVAYIRPEAKFSGLEALTAKLKEDQIAALALLGQ
jgi:riboflavin kinase/FMN adenylyltransferase